MATTTLERPGATDVRITVKLAPDDYRKPADAELKRLAKNVKLKGFRPGKVPVGYVKKMYGRGVVADAVGKAVDKEINELIKTEDLDIFGQLRPVAEPSAKELTDPQADELTFVYEGGLMPSVEEVDTSGLSEVTRYTVRLSDEEADEKLTGAAKRFVDYIERDTVETEEDFATLVVSDPVLDAKFLGAEGEAHSAEPTVGNDAKDDADGADTAEHDDNSDADEAHEERDPRQRYFLRPADLAEEQRYKLVDKARGTEVVLSLADLREDVRERFDKAITADGTTTFTIAKIDREQVPELGEETFKQIFGEDNDVTTLEAARAEFGRRFAENSQRNLDDFALEQVIDRLSRDNEVAVPDEAIKHRLERARAEEEDKAAEEGREPEFDHDLTEADRHGLARRLRWVAFRKALLARYSVELEPADIDAGIERAYVQQLSGMGIDPDQFRAQFFDTFKQNLLKNREQVMEMTDGLLNDKLLVRLEDEGVLGQRREVGEREFGQIVEEYNQRAGAEIEALRAQKL